MISGVCKTVVVNPSDQIHPGLQTSRLSVYTIVFVQGFKPTHVYTTHTLRYCSRQHKQHCLSPLTQSIDCYSYGNQRTPTLPPPHRWILGHMANM